MNVPGKEVAKTLSPIRGMLNLFAITEHPSEPDSRDETLIWSHKSYPRVLRQLRKVRGFKSLDVADAYICGYVRGLRDAVRESYRKKPRKRPHFNLLREAGFTANDIKGLRDAVRRNLKREPEVKRKSEAFRVRMAGSFVSRFKLFMQHRFNLRAMPVLFRIKKHDSELAHKVQESIEK